MIGRDADDDAQDCGETVGAWIARGRVKEMLAKGWRTLGPIGEGMVWMRGPSPDAADRPATGCGDAGFEAEETGGDAWARLVVPAVAADILRRRRAAVAALRAPHGRRVA